MHITLANMDQVRLLQKINVIVTMFVSFVILVNFSKNKNSDYLFLTIYSIVALCRSICVTHEQENACLDDHIFCRPMINRSLATIAEICISLFTISTISKIFGIHISNFLFLIIVTAQIFCWLGFLYYKSEMHVIEESLWVVFFGSILLHIFSTRTPYHKKASHNYIIFCIIMYMGYMILVDIPFYANYKQLRDKPARPSFSNCVISNDINDWKYVMLWQSLYFTCAVSFFCYLYILSR